MCLSLSFVLATSFTKADVNAPAQAALELPCNFFSTIWIFFAECGEPGVK